MSCSCGIPASSCALGTRLSLFLTAAHRPRPARHAPFSQPCFLRAGSRASRAQDPVPPWQLSSLDIIRCVALQPMSLRDVDASPVLLPRFRILSLSAQPPPQGSPLELFWLVPRAWAPLPHVRLARSWRFRGCQATCCGCNVLLFGFASGCGTSSPLPCRVLLYTALSCSPVHLFNPSLQPSNHFKATICCGPEVLCGVEDHLSAKRSDMIEWFASDTHPITPDVEGRQCPRCVPRHFKIELSWLVVAPICRSVKSLITRISPWIVWLARSTLPVGFLRRRFGWDVSASFVFGVDDAWFLVALLYHFRMTRGQHVGCECSFCVSVTRAFTRYHVGKEFVNPS